MKNHIYRPLYVVVALIAVILIARAIYVPKDFGIQARGYRFGWHRLGNEQEWKDFTSKYAQKDYCKGCHSDKADQIAASPHVIIPCQDCHGPALQHPDNPPKLAIDKARSLCLRCHAKLVDVGSGRAGIRGIDDSQHNPGAECVSCHNPHSPVI